MGTEPLTSIVVIEAHGTLWRLAPRHKTAGLSEPVLSTAELGALRLQMQRWSIHHPKEPETKTLSPEMVRAIAAVKRVFLVNNERALIEDWRQSDYQ